MVVTFSDDESAGPIFDRPTQPPPVQFDPATQRSAVFVARTTVKLCLFAADIDDSGIHYVLFSVAELPPFHIVSGKVLRRVLGVKVELEFGVFLKLVLGDSADGPGLQCKISPYEPVKICRVQ